MKETSYLEENITVVKLLKKINRFDAFTEEAIQSILELGKLREYEPGEIIIKEGDYDCWIYILLYGTLDIIKNNTVIGQLRRNGDLFGEMGIIDGSTRSATIRAESKSLTLGIDGSVIDRKMKKNDITFCYTIYRMFAEILSARLRATTEENVRLKAQIDKLYHMDSFDREILMLGDAAGQKKHDEEP